GELFCYQHVPDLKPDMVLVAKSLSGGMVPVGAALMRDRIYDSVYTIMDRCMVHSSTFGGGGLRMGCGLGSLNVIESVNLSKHVRDLGTYIREELQAMILEYDFLKDIRGKGLMIAMEFGPPDSLRLKPAWEIMHTGDQTLFPQAIIM